MELETVKSSLETTPFDDTSAISLLEIKRIVLCIAYALFNTGKMIYLQSLLCSYSHKVEMNWDVTRYEKSVKNMTSRVLSPEQVKAEQAYIRKYFVCPESQDQLNEPALFLDKFGKILLWHLPGILFQKRIVSSEKILITLNSQLVSNRTISIQVLRA